MASRVKILAWSLALSVIALLSFSDARAQYIQLWNIQSPQGADAATFDLGDESVEALFPMTQHGGQGAWAGGPAHSARALLRPQANNVHQNTVLPWPAHTVYGDTDGDGQLEFVSDNILTREILVWNAATGVVESRIPYPQGAVQFLYVLVFNVNATSQSCEIIGHWISGNGAVYGTICWGFAGATEAPSNQPLGSSSLQQNIPNPFGPSTEMRYTLSKPGDVSLAIYDARGRKVRVLVEGHQDAGESKAVWDRRDDAGRNVAAGVYYYELRRGSETVTRKAVVLQ